MSTRIASKFVTTLTGLLLAGALHAAGMETTPIQLPRQSDLAAGKAAAEAKDWKKAVENFSRAAAQEPANADIQNYLGHAYRMTGNLDMAFRHYNEALRLNPNHIGAHEYIGETFLMAKDPAKAEMHLAALQRLCGTGCEEYRDLQKAIAQYRAKN